MKKCWAVAVLRSFDFCHLMNPKGGRRGGVLLTHGVSLGHGR
jgi:hypothetical protein